MGLHTSSPARLDAEQVVQHGDDEVVMEIAIAVADHERDDRQPFGVADGVLDEAQRTTRRCVVGVDDGSRTEWPVDHLFVADRARADLPDQFIA